MAPKRTKRILNCLPSPHQDDDWDVASAAAAGWLDVRAPVPATFDLRAPWWPIGDQGGTGSCVGWATADSCLRWHYVVTGRLPGDASLSVRFLWMAAKETDALTTRPTTFIEPEGTTLKAALDVARKYGAVRDDDLPFADGALYPGDAKSFYARAAKLRIAGYVNLGDDQKQWRNWIATQGPVLVRLEVDDTWNDAADTGGALAAYHARTAGDGHAVALVGYTTEHFIVRNSWGTGWGDVGFGYASNAYAGGAFTEAYGVTLA